MSREAFDLMMEEELTSLHEFTMFVLNVNLIQVRILNYLSEREISRMKAAFPLVILPPHFSNRAMVIRARERAGRLNVIDQFKLIYLYIYIYIIYIS